MILRRFMKHFTDQNWFAVSVDLLVLVTGIFLGLQVDNWNEGRIERNEERVYLERMLQDADNSIAAQKIVIETMKSRIENIEQVTIMLHDNMITTENLALFSERLKDIGPWDNLQYFEDTIDEMISSGKLTTIRSLLFRNQLGRFRNAIGYNSRSNANLGSMIMLITDHLNGMLKWGPVKFVEYDENVPINSGMARSGQLLTPLDEINNNDDLYNQINAAARNYSALYRIEMGFHAHSNKFRQDISNALEAVR